MPRAPEIANSFIFGWCIPMWMLMGAIPTALLGLNMFTSIPLPHGDHLEFLIDANRQLWEDLVNHPFPRQMAQGTVPLNGFRHFMIQDATYLEFYARVRMQSIANSKSGVSSSELESFEGKQSSGLQYSKTMREVCTKQLGVPRDVVDSEPRSQPLEDAITLYERVAHEGDWLDMHIALLPCIMGYYTIAAKLLLDPETIRNTPYYTLWIQENANGVCYERYKKLIHDYINRLPESERRWRHWIDLFGKACQIESAFFNIAYEDFKYDVVSDGRYKIRSFGQDGLYLVPGGDGRVLVLQDDPDDHWTWQLTNDRDGYSIKHIASGTSLGVSVTDQYPPSYEVNSKGEGYESWSLNSVSLLGGTVLYQLFVSARLQFALDVHISGNSSRVFVANSYTGSSQLWILEPVA